MGERERGEEEEEEGGVTFCSNSTRDRLLYRVKPNRTSTNLKIKIRKLTKQYIYIYISQKESKGIKRNQKYVPPHVGRTTWLAEYCL